MADFIAYLLASWRLSRMLYDLDEAGPYDILAHIRSHAGVYNDEPGEFAEMLICPYCVSVWAGLVFSLLLLNKTVFRLLAWPFAASAATVLWIELVEPSKIDS